MVKRMQISAPTARRLSVALGSVFVAGCGGSAVLASASAQKYATTPVSAGAVNPKALPLGDGYVSTTQKVGYVDSCQTSFTGIGGARVNGPWINTRAKTWNDATKIAVSGEVQWPAGAYSANRIGSKRVIKFNDLPISHATGVFPISSSDPAYAYDRNGNHIVKQSVDWSLPLNPVAARTPGCTGGGPIGVLSDGVMLFNALDGEGRDAAAHEVLDACGGHPDPSNSYHHHDVPACIVSKAPNGRATLVGYALDGYGIYVTKSATGVLPTNRSLDACHGTTSKVLWNGHLTRVYHYVATLEYPYAVGCFHGTAISSGHRGGHGGPPPGR